MAMDAEHYYMKQSVILSHSAALRWGNTALLAALVGSLGVVGLVAWTAPNLTIFLPVALLALGTGAFLFTRPRLNFIVWLGAFALLFSSEKGIQLHEVAYGLYFYTYLFHWYVRRLFLYKRPIVHGRLDIALGLWLGLGLSLGVGVGLLFGADVTRIRGEWLALTMIAIYFPIKEFCMREKHGLAILLAILTFIGLWITFDNVLTARHTLASATALWEFETVRKAGRELLLAFSGIILLSVLPALKNHAQQIGIAVILVILLVGLILTKSRAYWVEYLVAVVILIAIAPGMERRRLVAWCVVGTGIISLISIVLLSSYINLLIAGASSRFATLGATSTDLSFLNRFVEASAVMVKVVRNPILGYGLATDYSFFDIIALGTHTRSYIHIGFVAVLYKFGLWGALLIAYVWLASLSIAFVDSRRKFFSAFERAVLRGIVACSASMILPAMTSSVFFESDKLSAFIFITALGVGLHFKYDKNTKAANRSNLLHPA